MKKRLSMVLVTIIIIIVITANILTLGTQQSQQSYNIPNQRSPLNIILRAEFPSPVDNMVTSYKVIPDEYNSSLFQTIANEFGLSGEIDFISTTPTSGKYVIKDDNKTLEYHASTGIWRYISNEAYPEVYQQPNLPSDNDGLSIAEEFLLSNGFWSQNITYSQVAYSYQRKGDKLTNEIIEEFVLTKTFYFDTTLNGIALGGVGSKYTVTMGEDGAIAAFTIPTRTFEMSNTDPLLSTNEILENLQNGTGIRTISRTIYDNRTVIITDISFCYYIGSLFDDLDNIGLSCRFKGNFEDVPDEGFSAYKCHPDWITK